MCQEAIVDSVALDQRWENDSLQAKSSCELLL